MEQFGKYSLVRKIGTGGMAEVYLARTTVAQGLAKTLVIKKIHPAYARSRPFVAMFVDEAKIALGLNHPNIVQVFDFGAVGETYFLAMENVEGLDLLRLLQDVVKDKRRIPFGLAAYIVQQLAKGLDYAHRKTDEFGEPLGIVHRDISPQNVLVSWDGAVKIVDFGIARARHVHEDEGVIKGKFAYMSPEQARGEPVDCRSDVFSAGIVLWELVCGRPLFPGRGKEALEQVKAGAIPPPRDAAPDVPPALEQIILKALAFHRDDRYATARELQADLGRFQLAWGHEARELVDSTALATFLASVVPEERRAPRMPRERATGTPAGPTTGSHGALSLGSLGEPLGTPDGGDRDDRGGYGAYDGDDRYRGDREWQRGGRERGEREGDRRWELDRDRDRGDRDRDDAGGDRGVRAYGDDRDVGHRGEGARDTGDRGAGDRGAGDRGAGDRGAGDRGAGDRGAGDCGADRGGGDRVGAARDGRDASGREIDVSDRADRFGADRGADARSRGDRAPGERDLDARSRGDRALGERDLDARSRGDRAVGDRDLDARSPRDHVSGERDVDARSRSDRDLDARGRGDHGLDARNRADRPAGDHARGQGDRSVDDRDRDDRNRDGRDRDDRNRDGRDRDDRQPDRGRDDQYRDARDREDRDRHRDRGRDDRSRERRPVREVRERKYVYVVEGVARGVASLERRLGVAGATKLVEDFRRVARDIAFKHDALEDRGERDLDSLRFVVGLPLAGEDDAGRTIRLALALVDALDGIGSDVEPELRLAVGIQRGAATVIRRGRDQRFEIEATTAGFAAHLARFAGPAEILVGGRVFRSARADWSFEALAAIDLPAGTDHGAAARVDEDTEPGIKRARVYRLRGPKERAARQRERAGAGALLGRELELKLLRDAYRDTLVSRRKRHLVISGDHGVGKRSLVSTFLASIPAGEAYVLRTSTRVATAMTPYGIIADLSREILGLADGAEPHEIQRRLTLAIPLLYPGEEDSREAKVAMATIGILLGARVADTAEVDPDERRQRMLSIMTRVEQRLEPERPLIIIGEDVHWCDQESLELFSALLKVPTARPLLGIVTTRPDRRILEAAAAAGGEVVHLDELDLEARRRLVAARFAPDEDIADLSDQILARAGGNPFFIVELIDALAERGILAEAPDHPGRYRWVRRDAPLQVPTSVEDLLVTRIDRLPERDKQALLYASVLGRVVSPPALAAMLGRQAKAELDELTRRGLLTPHDGEYRFKNDMIMTIAYGLVSADERTRLHRLVADRIATAPSYRPGQDDAHIARHLELAGDAIPSAERYLRAATHAIDVGGNADAFRQLSRALKLLPPGDHARRFQARRQREEILRRLARRPQQLRELSALRREAEAIGDPQKQALAHALLAQFYIDVGKAPAAQRAVAPALQYARDAGDKLLEADALRLRSAIARLVGNNDESLRLCDQALALCAQTGDGSATLLQRATILNNQGTTLWNMGRLEASIEAYAEALVIYRALGLPRQEARALNNMGIVFSSLGEYEEALAHYKSSLKIDQQLGDRSGVALKLGNIGQAYADVGDTDRAESYLAKAWKLGEQTMDPSSMADAAISWGQAKLARGDVAGALELLERGKDLASEGRERFQEIRGLEYIALAQLEAGQSPAGALELARAATDLARKMPMIVGIVYGLAAQGLALSRLGQHEAAIACTTEAVTIQSSQPRPEGAEHVLHWHAMVLATAGRVADARVALQRAALEIEAKALRLRDPALRAAYLGSKTPRAVSAALGYG